MNKRKLHGTIIAVIAFAIIIVGATFAWLTYSFNATNGVYNTATKCFDTISSEGQDINGELEYVTKPIDGVNTSIEMGLANNCRVSANVTLSINVSNETSSILYRQVPGHCENYDTLETLYNYDNITDCASNNGAWVTDGTALKYAIYDTNNPTSSTIPINVGYITGSGDNTLYETTLKIGSTDTYYIYIWLDGELIDENYMNAQFSGYVHANATQNENIQNYINAPAIVDGLIPVTLSKTGGKVTSVSVNDTTWYDYENKKWANAVLVNESTHTRSYYLNNPGTEIPQSDILAYYVWIPRYSYKVWRLSGVTINQTEANAEIHSIDIKFISTSTIENATSNGDWYTHPAFWWDNDSDGIRDSGEELTGIWIGKFETSHTTLSSSSTQNNLGCSFSGCTTYNGLRILPNVGSLRYNSVSSFFYASRAMETSGNSFGISASSIDSHMMKNSEWGATAYLSHSKYGINTEVRINNQNSYLTGCGADVASATSTAICSNTYGTQITYPQSTTGNVTGVFDMSGGTLEYVMGVYNKNSNRSGFNDSTNLWPEDKYYDNYTISYTSCTLVTCGGHALNETKNWHNDAASFVDTTRPWFFRGGGYNGTSSSGIFSYGGDYGSTGTVESFRLVLMKKNSEQ